MIGKVFGRYRILEKLGQGGMGEVWLAEDKPLDRKVALKFPAPQLAQDPAARKRFLREARSAAALDHPYICSIHEVAETDATIFIAMEYVQGQTLRQVLDGEKLPLSRVLDILSEIVEALGPAHGKGIVHRDLKPSNIMITSVGHVKVMDFGLAKRLTNTPTEDMDTASGLTGKSVQFGTPAYMSPEQVRGEGVDARSDIFSLGLIFYEMLAGVHPFVRATTVERANAILNDAVPPITLSGKDRVDGVEAVLARMLAKDPAARYQKIAEVGQDLDACRKKAAARPASISRSRGRRKLIAAAAAAVVILAYPVYSYVSHNMGVRWAHEKALPEIEQLAGQESFTAAFALATDAQRYIPEDQKLKELLTEVSTVLSVETEPPGGEVFLKDYQDASGQWQRLGQAPLQDVVVSRGFKRLKIERTGSAPVERAIGLAESSRRLNITLMPVGDLPEGMVRVVGGTGQFALTGIDPIERTQIDDFFIDRYEVTNSEFKKFVEAGGYQKQEFWKHPFVKDGRSLAWSQAIAEFRDRTGRTAPATWELGDYPEGQDEFPVTGVSWYEAAAYAEFVGKSLPTVYHWVRAADTQTGKYLIPFSNFGGSGSRATRAGQAMGVTGAYDMAGNVREWCWNSSGDQRYILGGSWADATYLFNFVATASPFDRSSGNGFRTAQYLPQTKLTADVSGPIELVVRDYSKEKPASDEIFQIYKSQFAYDKTDLDAKVESRDETNPHWITEKVTFRSAYGSERVTVYLTIPKMAQASYQTLVYFPGSSAISTARLENVPGPLDFIVRSGRVLVSVVLKGTFERNDGLVSTWPSTTHQYSEYLVKWVKDFKRTVDYLETRSEFDTKRLGYLGYSWGGRMGAIIPAVDDRFDVSVIVLGGLAAGRARPEVDQINFISRVKIPVLMLNGKYDALEPVDSAQIPMFRMWGTPPENKRHVSYESNGHIVPRNDLIKETLDWLDKYLGPVR